MGTSAMKKRIVCLGRILVDVIAQDLEASLPAFSTPRLVRDVGIFVGGSGGATSIAFRQLGTANGENEVISVGRVGTDLAGTYTLHRLRDFGVNTTHIRQVSEHRTAVHLVAVDGFGNARYVATDGADLRLARFGADNSDPEFRDVDLLHIGNFERFAGNRGEPLLSWIQNLRRLNPDLIVSVDACKERGLNGYLRFVSDQVDFYFANQFEARHAVSTEDDPATDPLDACERVLGMGVRRAAIIKMGEHGAFVGINEKGNGFDIKYREGSKVTTCNENGAGNIFCASVLHNVIRDVDLSDAVERANKVAAVHVAQDHGIIEDSDFHEKLDAELASLVQACTPKPVASRSEGVSLPEDRSKGEGTFDRSQSLKPFQISQWVARLLDSDLGGLERGGSVLDLGCGSGRFAHALYEHSLQLNITGIDKDRSAIEKARSVVDNNSRMKWVVGDILNLNQCLRGKGESFDVVWASSLLQSIPDHDWQGLLSQVHGMLRDKGKIVLRTITAELLAGIWLYRWFPSGQQDIMRRLPTFPVIWNHLLDQGFVPKYATLVEDSSDVSLDEVVDRISARPYAWTRNISDADLQQGLDNLRRRFDGHIGMLQWQQPAWFIVAERRLDQVNRLAS